jgi:hypothetical protein
MEIKDIKPGMVFRFVSKYDNQSYMSEVLNVFGSASTDFGIHFIAKNGVSYRENEVEWLDEIREDKLNQLLK